MAFALVKPSAVIFDWDNTLVDTWPIIHAALNATLARMNKPLWTFEMTKERVRKSMRDSFPEVFGTDWEEAGRFYQAYYRANHLEKLTPLPHVVPLLETIKRRGLYCVVVSNKKGDNLRQEVAHLGWGHYFAKVVGADDASRDKPYADPVLLAFAGHAIKPASDVWFVGDSDIDLECAAITGCTAILYGPVARAHSSWTPSHLGGQPYHYFAHDHQETLSLFERFCQ